MINLFFIEEAAGWEVRRFCLAGVGFCLFFEVVMDYFPPLSIYR